MASFLEQAATFPLWPIIVNEGEPPRCGCGNADCTRIGKHGPTRYGSLTKGQQVPAPPTWTNYGTAICTGERSGVVIADLDVSEADGDKPTKNGPGEWARLVGANMPKTLTIKTGGGGYQLYFQWPGFRVRNSVCELAPGIDIRGDGGIAVAAGSPHKSGRKYEVLHDLPIAPLPAWLLQWPGLRSNAATPADTGGGWSVDPESEEGQRRIEMARTYLAEAEPAIGDVGLNGSKVCLAVAQYLMRTLQLPLDVARDLFEEIYNPRCEPPWSRKEIDHKLTEARDKMSTPVGMHDFPCIEEILAERAAKAANNNDAPDNARAGDDAGFTASGATPKRRVRDPNHTYSYEVGDDSNGNKKTKTTPAAMQYTLFRHPDWAGVLQFNRLSEKIVAVNPPLALDAEKSGSGLSDSDVVAVQSWFEGKQDKLVGLDNVRNAVTVVAERLRFHPVHEYLEGLPAPAGEPVIHRLAELIFGCTEKLANEFIEKFLVGAVRRILRPGTKMDTVLVLVSPEQGLHKSSFVPALFGDEWIRRQLPELSSKDASIALRGAWAIELGELEKIIKADNATVKDFLSRDVDNYRPPFGRSEVVQPRQCVFIGTANEQQFLTDPTGNRRFWPIDVSRKMDLEFVRSHREQIWAEALALARRPAIEGHPGAYLHWYPNEADAEPAREAFLDLDPWHNQIRDYCAGRDWIESATKIYVEVICADEKGATARCSKRETNRIGATLKRLGVHPATRWEGDRKARGWAVPASLRDTVPSTAETQRRAAADAVERLAALSHSASN